MDFRRSGMELSPPSPRHYRNADRLASRGERRRIQDDLDRRNGASPPPQVDDRPFAPARPRRSPCGERVHEPQSVDRVHDLLGERVRPLRRELPDPLSAVHARRLRPPQELLDQLSDRSAQGGDRASSFTAFQVRERHRRHDGFELVEELHHRIAFDFRS